MKKLICALLSIFVITPCLANIHINSTAVTDAIAKHFPDPDARNAAHAEYNAQIKNAGGEHAGIPASGVWQVCKAAGLDITKYDGESKCRAFDDELIKNAHWKFLAACGKDKKVSGAVCVNDFATLTVNRQQAEGLAKLYARNKSDNMIQCKSKPRMEATTTASINPHAMGMSSTSNTPYLQCTSYNSNKFYEF